MTRYLLAVDSVHGAAAACDYLVDRIDPDDELFVISATGGRDRDADDATNVLRVRLPVSRTEPIRSDDGGAADVFTTARDVDADLIVVSCHEPEAEGTALESIRERLFAEAERPVVVLPSA